MSVVLNSIHLSLSAPLPREERLCTRYQMAGACSHVVRQHCTCYKHILSVSSLSLSLFISKYTVTYINARAASRWHSIWLQYTMYVDLLLGLSGYTCVHAFRYPSFLLSSCLSLVLFLSLPLPLPLSFTSFLSVHHSSLISAIRP